MKKLLSYALLVATTVFPVQLSAAGHRSVTLEAPGTLESILGEEALSLDSLSLVGPINGDDFQTMWNSSFNGQLSYLNLADAIPEEHTIPEKAFYHSKEQNAGAFVRTLSLRELILPDDIVNIDDFALMHVNLNSLILPSSLKRIGVCAFSDSRTIWGELVIPENVEEIGHGAFFQNPSIESISFPSSLKSIGEQAFYGTRPKSITFSEGLESIGAFAFGGSYVEQLILPNSLKSIGQCAFQQMHCLKSLRLPSSLETIPTACFSGCALEELTIPGNIKAIAPFAFQNCYNLTKITFEQGVEYLGVDSFSQLDQLQEVYSESQIPPLCDYNTEVNSSTGVGPFGNPHYGTPTTAILYVPVQSVDAYHEALGWNYFRDIRPFSFSGIADVVGENGASIVRVVEGGVTIESEIPTFYVVCGIDGKIVTEGDIDNGSLRQLTLPEGLYLVSLGDTCHKVYVK